jgi:hypothetical protein
MHSTIKQVLYIFTVPLDFILKKMFYNIIFASCLNIQTKKNPPLVVISNRSSNENDEENFHMEIVDGVFVQKARAEKALFEKLMEKINSFLKKFSLICRHTKSLRGGWQRQVNFFSHRFFFLFCRASVI